VRWFPPSITAQRCYVLEVRSPYPTFLFDLSKKGNLKRQVEYASHTAQTVFEEYSNSDELHILAASCVRWGDVSEYLMICELML
jgi:hypothetical protein